MVTSLSKIIVSTLYLDGCHDFCATGEGGYLNTAVECSLDSCELQNFIAKLCSANDEKPIVELSVSEGGERERGRGKIGEVWEKRSK